MTDRLEKIFSEIDPCHIFADVGCDHGYVSYAMLKSGKCKKAIITDVSEKCLDKARKLLSAYIEDGSAESYVSDGFDKITYCDLALIAGMGGEEVVKILSKSKFLPDKLCLQPMKNTPKLRSYLVLNGYKIDKDYVFYSGNKFYDLITVSKGKDVLTEDEIAFGRTNLKERSKDFIDYLLNNKGKLLAFSERQNLSEEDKQKMLKEIKKIDRILQS